MFIYRHHLLLHAKKCSKFSFSSPLNKKTFCIDSMHGSVFYFFFFLNELLIYRDDMQTLSLNGFDVHLCIHRLSYFSQSSACVDL